MHHREDGAERQSPGVESKDDVERDQTSVTASDMMAELRSSSPT